MLGRVPPSVMPKGVEHGVVSRGELGPDGAPLSDAERR